MYSFVKDIEISCYMLQLFFSGDFSIIFGLAKKFIWFFPEDGSGSACSSVTPSVPWSYDIHLFGCIVTAVVSACIVLKTHQNCWTFVQPF